MPLSNHELSVSAEELLAGSYASLPLLDKLLSQNELNSGLNVEPTLLCFRGILGAVNADELLPAIRGRRDRLARDNPVAAHGLALATAQKAGCVTKYLVAHGGVSADDRSTGYKGWFHAYTGSGAQGPGIEPYMPGALSEHPAVSGHNEGPPLPIAENNHNHRHGLVSLILRGGYSAEERRFPDPDAQHELVPASTDLAGWTAHTQHLENEYVTYRPGDCMSMHPDEGHRLYDILPGTVTVVLETPSVRNYSIQFDGDWQAQIQIPGYVDAWGRALTGSPD